MTIITVRHSQISGQLTAPSSKSYAQRALASALLAKGTSILRNPCRADDALAATEVIKNLGATVHDFGDRLIIHGGMSQVRSTLDFGESGLGIRLFSAIAALNHYPVYLTGSGSLTKRPMNIIQDALTPLGVSCTTDNGFIPLRVQGPLKAGRITVDGSVSSQVLTGLIMALPTVEEDSTIKVKNLKSTPYIDMTLEVMDSFGVKVNNKDYKEFFIKGGQIYTPRDYIIEGDWSGAAFLLVAGAIGGECGLSGLNLSSRQADRKILEALDMAGADIVYGEEIIRVSRNNLKGFDFDASHCPDLFPPLAALAVHCSGTTSISGVDRLIHKESNRAEALETEMSKLGVDIKIKGNNMIIHGPATISGTEIDSRNDHRIAMAAATVILPCRNQEVAIKGAECTAKSYPSFYEDLKTIGGQIDE